MTRLLAKLVRADGEGRSGLIWLRPRLFEMPLPIQRYDDPFLPFSKAVIAATRDRAAGYIFDFAAYLALGGAGAIALERAIAYVIGGSDAAAILHAPFSTGAYALAMGETAYAVDGVTVTDAGLTAAYAAVGVTAIPAGELLPDALTIPGWPSAVPVYGDAIVYAGRDDDFAAAARAALIAAQGHAE